MIFHDFQDLRKRELDTEVKNRWKITLIIPILGTIAYRNVIKRGRRQFITSPLLFFAPTHLIASGATRFSLLGNIVLSIVLSVLIVIIGIYLELFNITTKEIGQSTFFSDQEKLKLVWISLIPMIGTIKCLRAINSRHINE